jgi:hypothetical protein
MHSDFAKLCEPVRWGTHGSRVVDRAKGVWHDHERGVGGGTLDLVPGATKKDRLQWLRDRGLIGSSIGDRGVALLREAPLEPRSPEPKQAGSPIRGGP